MTSKLRNPKIYESWKRTYEKYENLWKCRKKPSSKSPSLGKARRNF